MKLAVLGTPIAHSRSPQLQECFAEAAGIKDFSYERIECDCPQLEVTVARLVCEDYAGFNCTMPLKTDMSELADTLTEEAKRLHSVNTVTIFSGRLNGDTTDGGGIILSARRALGDNLKGLRCVLLGAGGSARSAALSLYLAGAELTILNRTPESAARLVEMLGGGAYDELTPESLVDYAKSADLLVNCTSQGMTGKDAFKSLAFVDSLPRDAVVIDAVYNPLETELLRTVRESGRNALSGLWMLVYQGALAFRNWTGVLPDEEACERAFERIK